MAKLEKILTMTDADIQRWLRVITEEDLLKGLAGIGNETEKRILANMSESAGKVINEYLEKKKGLAKSEIDASLDRLEKALKAM
jgi:flagellar motor switch protein FliG